MVSSGNGLVVMTAWTYGKRHKIFLLKIQYYKFTTVSRTCGFSLRLWLAWRSAFLDDYKAKGKQPLYEVFPFASVFCFYAKSFQIQNNGLPVSRSLFICPFQPKETTILGILHLWQSLAGTSQKISFCAFAMFHFLCCLCPHKQIHTVSSFRQ